MMKQGALKACLLAGVATMTIQAASAQQTVPQQTAPQGTSSQSAQAQTQTPAPATTQGGTTTSQDQNATAASEPVTSTIPPADPSNPLQADTQTMPNSEIVVTGFREAYLNALQMKRNDNGISDSISSDGLGRFPDLNVGEALQRIPGVQINRDAGSRDATINLRGLPGNYARYTINGQSYADPVLGGSTPLGAFNSDVFSAIAVKKTIAPTDQAGGLSGIVDLQLQPALDRKDGGYFKVSGEYDTLGDYFSPAATLGYNLHLTPDIAIYGIVGYKREKFRRDSIYDTAYSPLAPGSTVNFARFNDYYAPFQADGSCASGNICAPNGTGQKGTKGVLYPSDVREASAFNEGSLLTAAGGVGWQATPSFKIGLTGFYTRRSLSDNRTNLLEVDMRSRMVTIDPTTSPTVYGDGNAYIQGFDFSNAQINDSVRREPLTEKLWDAIGTAEWSKDDWRVTGTVTKSRGENNLLQTQIDLRNLPKTGGNGINGSFNSGGGDLGNFALNVNRDPLVKIPPQPYSFNPSSQPVQTAANGDQLIVAGSSGYGRNEVTAGEGQVERDFNLPFLKSIVIGGRYEHREYVSRGYRLSAKGVQTQNIDSGFLSDNPYDDDFFGGAAGDYQTFPAIDYDYALSHLLPVTAAPGDLVTPLGFINDPTNSAYTLYNFTVRNSIWSGYGQANLSFDLFNIPIKGYAGVRYEHTDQRINAQARQIDANGNPVFAPQEFNQSYSNWLPSVYLSASLTPKLLLRGAYSQAFVRPSPRSLTPATTVSSTTTGYSLQYGGANLKPYSDNAEDLSLEWYNRPGGLFAIALFRKEISGLISPETRTSRLCPPDATQYGLGHLTIIGDTCYSDIQINGQPAIVSVSGSYNRPNPITVKGIELTAQQNFDFLPGLLRNLGGQVNYSYIDASGKTADGSQAVLPGVSKNNVNVIGYYESEHLGVRVVYTWRDKYTLTGGSSFTGGQSFVTPRSQVDASVSYKFTDNISVSLDAFNLSNAKREQYEVSEALPRQADYDGRTFTVSVHGNF